MLLTSEVSLTKVLKSGFKLFQKPILTDFNVSKTKLGVYVRSWEFDIGKKNTLLALFILDLFAPVHPLAWDLALG